MDAEENAEGAVEVVETLGVFLVLVDPFRAIFTIAKSVSCIACSLQETRMFQIRILSDGRGRDTNPSVYLCSRTAIQQCGEPAPRLARDVFSSAVRTREIQRLICDICGIQKARPS